MPDLSLQESYIEALNHEKISLQSKCPAGTTITPLCSLSSYFITIELRRQFFLKFHIKDTVKTSLCIPSNYTTININIKNSLTLKQTQSVGLNFRVKDIETSSKLPIVYQLQKLNNLFHK